LKGPEVSTHPSDVIGSEQARWALIPDRNASMILRQEVLCIIACSEHLRRGAGAMDKSST
jgi:hypothetical protein